MLTKDIDLIIELIIDHKGDSLISQKQMDEIVSNVEPDKIILFGSYASNKDSDLDILVVNNMNIPRYRRSREIRKYLRDIKIPIDLIVYSQDEIDEWKDNTHAFINKVIKQGKVLYSNELNLLMEVIL